MEPTEVCCIVEGKKAAKGKDKSKEGTLKPSDVELRNAICEILKEVDFNTVRFQSLDRLVGDYAFLPLLGARLQLAQKVSVCLQDVCMSIDV